MSDAYHTCYVLSGLSAAQHQWELDEIEPEGAPSTTDDAAADAAAMWAVLPYLDGPQIFDNADRVRPIHPVYAIPQQSVRAIREYFEGVQGF